MNKIDMVNMEWGLSEPSLSKVRLKAFIVLSQMLAHIDAIARATHVLMKSPRLITPSYSPWQH
jgi:hypothetical protein